MTKTPAQTARQGLTNLSPKHIQARLIAAQGWEARYRELLLLAKEQPTPTDIRQEHYAVTGCQAQVWLQIHTENERYWVQTDSQSRLVRALLLVLTAPIQGQDLTFLQNFSWFDWLKSCGLEAHLSESRANGLKQVINQLQHRAQEAQ